jgi:hypothetical protein
VVNWDLELRTKARASVCSARQTDLIWPPSGRITVDMINELLQLTGLSNTSVELLNGRNQCVYALQVKIEGYGRK